MRSEDGFALPTVLLMLIAAFAIVSVGVAATVDVQRGTNRDQSTKSAVQLAEAGVNTALLHFNRIDAGSTGCAVGGGWCQGPTYTDPNGGTYSYQMQVLPYPTTAGCVSDSSVPYSLEVVGTGTTGAATRRVDVLGHSASGIPILCDYQVKAGDGITMDSNSHIYAGTATNGTISISSNAGQCGPASVGVGEPFPTNGHFDNFSGGTCSSPDSSGGHNALDLPPVNQGDVTTNNNNRNFFGSDVVSGNHATACWNGTDADGSTGTCGTRHLNVGTTSTVTLVGSRYSFCKLTMDSNSSLLVASGTSTYIYFDSPENCGYPSGTSQLTMSSNTRISSNDGSPVYLLFVGSTSRQTTINMNSNTDINAACQQNLVVYAPLSDIDMNSNTTYCGAFAGKTINLNSNANIVTTTSAKSFTPPNTPPHYKVDRFTDCTTAAATPPSTGC
jgi:hypothetical protein